MRIFVAIDLPEAARHALEILQDDLPVGRPMAPETFHLTLSFLDEQPSHVVSAVHEELATIRFDPFPLILSGLDTFGGGKPKLLWAGVAPQPALSALHRKVRGAAARAGLEMPRARFRPHVTLARFRGDLRGEELAKLGGFLAHHAGFVVDAFQARGFTLFQSVLGPGGATHEALADYPARSPG